MSDEAIRLWAQSLELYDLILQLGAITAIDVTRLEDLCDHLLLLGRTPERVIKTLIEDVYNGNTKADVEACINILMNTRP